MSDKFLSTSGANINISNGTTTIFGSVIGALNLDPSQPVKTNSVRQLVSSKLDIADITNLQTSLNAAISNPYVGTLKVSDLETDDYFSINTEIQKVDNLTTSTLNNTNITGFLNTDDIQTTSVFDATRSSYIEMGSTNINVNATTLTFNGDTVGDVAGPISSVDNAIVSFDGVTGKLIKDSGVVIESGIMSGVSSIITSTVNTSNVYINNKIDTLLSTDLNIGITTATGVVLSRLGYDTNVKGNLTCDSNITPTTTNVSDLGSTTKKFKDMYLENNLILGGSITKPLTTINNVALLSSVDQGYTVSSSFSAQPNWQAFDKTIASWQATSSSYNTTTGNYIGAYSTILNTGTYTGEWIQLQLPSIKRINKFSIGLTTLSYNIRDFKIAGSTDGSSWYELYSTIVGDSLGFIVYNGSNSETNVISLNTPMKISYIRLIVNKTIPGTGAHTVLLSDLTYFNDLVDIPYVAADTIQSKRYTCANSVGGASGADNYIINNIPITTMTSNASKNILIGSSAGGSITSGNNNVATGHNAMYKNTTGINNAANGYQSLYNNVDGANNSANGYKALYLNAGGSSNVANGIQSLFSNTSGLNNTACGANSALSGNYSNTISLGSGAQCSASEQFTFAPATITVLKHSGNGICDLGSATNKFKDLYLSGELSMTSTTKSLVLPKVTPSAQDNITTVGSLVYNPVNNKINFYNGTIWQQLSFTTVDAVPAFNIPALTTNTSASPNYIASESSFSATFPAYQAFDKTTAAWFSDIRWLSGLPNGQDTFNTGAIVINGSWLKISMNDYRRIYGFVMNCINAQKPTGWQIYYSNDGTNWSLAYTQTASYTWVGNTTGIVDMTKFDCKYVALLVTNIVYGYSTVGINNLTFTGYPRFNMPVLTGVGSATSVGYTESSSSNYSASWLPWNAFNPASNWYSIDSTYNISTGVATAVNSFSTGSSTINGSWLKVSMDIERMISRFTLDEVSIKPTSWEIWYSNDNINYTSAYTTGGTYYTWSGSTTGVINMTPFSCKYVVIVFKTTTVPNKYVGCGRILFA